MGELSSVRLDQGAVEFIEIECCALNHAAENIYNKDFVNRAVATAKGFCLPPHVSSLFGEKFIKTKHFSFIPYELLRGFYLELACREKQHCSTFAADHILLCRHTIEQHITALNNVSIKMSQPYNRN